MISTNVPGSMTCLDDQQLRDVMFSDAEPQPLEALEQHLDTCDRCRSRVAAVLRANVHGQTAEDVSSIGVLSEPGDSIGRYVVVELLGAGAMAVVYAAYDPQLDRKVALKVLRPDVPGLEGATAAAQVAAEAQAMARLSHPNVIIVHDVSTIAGQLFIAMEYIDGGSLLTWLSAAQRPWREVLVRFVAAGRGLEAVHRAGLLHGDFKPANVLLGANGAVRVTDFGLSSPLALTHPSRRSVGTPGYMAPEQLDNAQAGALADQFSFCVAVWESLAGSRPFTGDSLVALRQSMTSTPAEPEKSEVPRWVRRVLQRGLRANPAERFPSLDDLLRALDLDIVAQRRKRWVWAAVVTLAAAMVGLAAGRGDRHRCEGEATKLIGVWDDDVRARVSATFGASKMPYASTQLSSSTLLLDAAAAAWRDSHRSVCEATWVRGEQSALLLDLRMNCLEKRRQAIAALTALFAKADDSVVEHALMAVQSLESPESCTVLPPGKPPSPPSAALTSLHVGLGEVRALLDTGQFTRAETQGPAVVAEASALGDLALAAEAEFLLGRAKAKTGDPRGAEDRLYQSIAYADQAGATRTAAQGWAELVFVQGTLLGLADAAHHSETLGRAALSKVVDVDIEASLERAAALALAAEARFDEAERSLKKVLALRQQTHGGADLQVGLAWLHLGSVLYGRGDFDEAASVYRTSLEILERVLGPGHPDVAMALGNAAIVEMKLSRDANALAMLRRAQAISASALGPQSARVGRTLINICEVLISIGQFSEALASCRGGVATLEKALAVNHPALASALNSLGSALLRKSQLDEAASSFARALALREVNLGPTHPDCAHDLVGLGLVALQRGHPADAIAPFERALVLREKLGNPVLLAEVQGRLARALWLLKRDRTRVERLVATAKEMLTSAGEAGRRPLAELDQWNQRRAAGETFSKPASGGRNVNAPGAEAR